MSGNENVLYFWPVDCRHWEYTLRVTNRKSKKDVKEKDKKRSRSRERKRSHSRDRKRYVCESKWNLAKQNARQSEGDITYRRLFVTNSTSTNEIVTMRNYSGCGCDWWCARKVAIEGEEEVALEGEGAGAVRTYHSPSIGIYCSIPSVTFPSIGNLSRSFAEVSFIDISWEVALEYLTNDHIIIATRNWSFVAMMMCSLVQHQTLKGYFPLYVNKGDFLKTSGDRSR
jgi:hypothetical protein